MQSLIFNIQVLYLSKCKESYPTNSIFVSTNSIDYGIIRMYRPSFSSKCRIFMNTKSHVPWTRMSYDRRNYMAISH